jgi:quercetin dioxygenase-like cupin family protein
MPLFLKADDVKDGEAILEIRGGRMSTKYAYGKDCNIMVATRSGGYHSIPHTHDAEQINYVTDGELWCFVGDKGFLAKEGDFVRIPKNAVHWGWNISDKPCTIVEIHTPPVAPEKRKNGVGLFDEAEDPSDHGSVPSINVEMDVSEIERKVLKAAGVVID